MSNNINRKTFDKEFKFEEGQWIKFESNNINLNDINATEMEYTKNLLCIQMMNIYYGHQE